MKIKKGDEIMVTGGKDRGKRGKVETVLTKESAVVVPGLNVFKRHMKKRDAQNPGGIVDIPRALPLARVALICPKCKKPTRVGFQAAGKEKHRICSKCKQLI
ncbi:TPA: 50S ribosomal protein L24 [Patescibacteria group bacterium]|uniref:Large ribosomal subunit protein uL24 n=1 Tax=Candidatus Gottesmanbacteria bacterium GW2011_GWA1_43_11 TaxID=1618436 RepID=A0A0G1FCQ5_9BACT|nr:MAG: 50S ribosomal protein L24 [Candidatus Gottesmanbacteria bacterium GW2011_GWA1_43_11]HCS78463.1 50S ribosomal protein L24 [Patescibacteria group bacterium]